MKYSVQARQPKATLELADEIIVEANDYAIIPDFFHDYPEKTVILDVQELNDKYKDIILRYKEASPYFVVRVSNLMGINWLKENNIAFYYKYPVSTFYDVKGLYDLGAKYICVMAPLTFQIRKLADNYGHIFRMVPNVAYSAYIPRKNGLYGQWVRPEDVKYYDPAIAAFDFEDCDLQKERGLLHIYKENGEWPGNLNKLITNLGVDCDNRAILPELGPTRSHCGQKCMSGGSCHFCETAVNFQFKVIDYYNDTHKETT